MSPCSTAQRSMACGLGEQCLAEMQAVLMPICVNRRPLPPQTLDLKQCFDFFNEKSVIAADQVTQSGVIAARNQWPEGQVRAACL